MKVKSALSILTPFVLRHPRLLFLGGVGIAGGTAINLLLPQGVRLLVSEAYFPYVLLHPWRIMGAVIFCLAVQGIFFYLRALAFLRLGQQVTASLRERLFGSVLERSITFFEEQKSTDLVSRMIADLTAVQDVLSFKLSVVIRYLLQACVGFGLMLWISPVLTLWMLLGLPPLVLLAMALGKRLKKASRNVQEELGKQASLAQETFGNMRVVRTFDVAGFLRETFQKLSQSWQVQAKARAHISAFFSSFVNFLLVSLLASGMLYGLHLVSMGYLTAADFTAFLLYGMIVGVSFAFLAGGVAEFSQALGSAERALELCREPLPEQKGSVDPAINVIAQATPISIESVSFSYPSRPNDKALHNVSLDIPAGANIAFVGPSGAGKSTLALLTLGLYGPTEGTIRYGLDAASSKRMAYVPQEPELFGMSLAENLRMGSQLASNEELLETLESVGLMPWYRSLSAGLQTPLGERGLQVSGGQRQRLAIARALLRRPSLLVLDEPTAALDSETEVIISDLLAKMHGQTTIITIAHRLSTIQRADKIYVLQAGAVTQVGTHAELSATPGLYRRLVELSGLS